MPPSSLVPILLLCPVRLTVSALVIHSRHGSFSLFVMLALTVGVFLSLGSHLYHLRVYVYQARNLIAMDKDSFSGLHVSLSKACFDLVKVDTM